MSMKHERSLEIDPTKVVILPFKQRLGRTLEQSDSVSFETLLSSEGSCDIPTKSTEQEAFDESKDSSNSVTGETVILDDTNAPKVLVYRYPKKDKFIVPDATEYKEKLRKIRHMRNKKFVRDTKKEMMNNFKEGYHNKYSTITLCNCPSNQVPRYLRIANKLFTEKGYNVVMVRDGNIVDVIKSICADKPYQCRLVLTV